MNSPPTVLQQIHVEMKEQENMNCMDILKDIDNSQCDHQVDKTILCDVCIF